MRYTTRQDAIDLDIAPALTDGNFDLDAIFDEAYEWKIDHDEHGNELLDTAGFESVVSEDKFWEIAARHDLDAK